MNAHKRSLILQAELGGVEFPTNEQYAKYKRQFIQDKNILFSHIHRLIHCVVDCQIHKQDGVAVRHALELARSFSARVWDNSPYQMKQFPQVGLVAIRKLALGGINSIEALEATEPHRIELLLSRNPPFGQKLLDNLKDFPKLRVSIKFMGKVTSKGRPVIAKIKADCGFMNDKVPVIFQRKPVYICLLTERSDGHLIDFKRISATNLNSGKDFLMSVELLSQTQFITCYIMCDAVAGTLQHAELKPDLPAHLFPQPQDQRRQIAAAQDPRSKMVLPQVQDGITTSPATLGDDEFDEYEIQDQDMVDAVTGLEFHDVDNIKAVSCQQNLASNPQHRSRANPEETSWNPEKLENGKWACNHKCKDKTGCKHMCCREGVDKAPKPPKSAFVSAASLLDTSSITKRKDANTQKLPTKKPMSSHPTTQAQPVNIETVDLVEWSSSGGRTKKAPRELKSLERLHDNVFKGSAAPLIAQKGASHIDPIGRWLTAPLPNRDAYPTHSSDRPSTDYGGDWMANLPSPSALLEDDHDTKELQARSSISGGKFGISLSPALPRRDAATIETNNDNDSLEDFDLSKFDGDNDDEKSDIEAALVGFSDSFDMNEEAQRQGAPNGSQGKSKAIGLPWRNKDVAADICACTGNDQAISSKLFVSTDSPEKQFALPEKRARSIGTEARDFSLSPPLLKRLRPSSEADPALQPSTSAANRAIVNTPIIKPGQPAWVYEFDPAFIAEWQDVVDFV